MYDVKRARSNKVHGITVWKSWAQHSSIFRSRSVSIILSLARSNSCSLSFGCRAQRSEKKLQTTVSHLSAMALNFCWKAMTTNNDVVVIIHNVMNTEQRTNQLMLWWQVRAPSAGESDVWRVILFKGRAEQRERKWEKCWRMDSVMHYVLYYTRFTCDVD